MDKGMILLKKAFINFKLVTPSCGLCAKGKISPSGDSVLCPKTGIRALNSHCRSFCYDPLKRKPMRVKAKTDFEESDIEL